MREVLSSLYFLNKDSNTHIKLDTAFEPTGPPPVSDKIVGANAHEGGDREGKVCAGDDGDGAVEGRSVNLLLDAIDVDR